MKPEQWHSHIEAYRQTTQSKRAYTTEHNLSYSQFLYWSRKQTITGAVVDSADDFISVDIQDPVRRTHSGLGTLEFPNGSKLLIHDVELLQPLISICLGRVV